MKIRHVWDEPGVSVPHPFRREVRMVFGPDREEVKDLNLICALIPAGSSTDRRGRDRTELIYIVEGKGEFFCNGKTHPLGPDTCVYVEAGDVIQIRNSGEDMLKLVSVYRDPFRAEDLYRRVMDTAREGVSR